MNGKWGLQIAVVMLVAGTSLLGSAVQAQLGRRSETESKEADGRVQQALDAMGWKYMVDEEGDYVLAFRFKGQEQGQIVYVGSATNTLGTLEIREVFAPGIISESALEPEVLDELLVENCKVKVGAWRLIKNSQQQVALFCAQVAADADARALATIVEAVALTAQLKRDGHAASVRTEGRTPAKRSEPSAARKPLMAANW